MHANAPPRRLLLLVVVVVQEMRALLSAVDRQKAASATKMKQLASLLQDL